MGRAGRAGGRRHELDHRLWRPRAWGCARRWQGSSGDDLFGRFMLAELEARGVDTGPSVVDPTCPTGISAVLVEPGDRATLTFRGTIGGLRADMVGDDLLARARHVHTRWLVPAGRRAGAGRHPAAGAGGRSDHIPRSGRRPRRRVGRRPDPAAPRDRPSAPQRGRGTGARPGSRTSRRRPGGSLRPARGLSSSSAAPKACWPSWTARWYGRPPCAVDVVDTIGAGDSSNAGWLAGVLNGWPADRSARLAAACGSLSTRARGGTSGQPTLAEALTSL